MAFFHAQKTDRKELSDNGSALTEISSLIADHQLEDSFTKVKSVYQMFEEE